MDTFTTLITLLSIYFFRLPSNLFIFIFYYRSSLNELPKDTSNILFEREQDFCDLETTHAMLEDRAIELSMLQSPEDDEVLNTVEEEEEEENNDDSDNEEDVEEGK